MAWHQWAFYTSLAVWIIVIPFEPELPSPRRGYPTTKPWPYSWCSFLTTLISAGIMYLGYHRLWLYLEEKSAALAAVRAIRGSREIHRSRSEETVMVTRTFVERHNQLTSFLSNYPYEVEEAEAGLRTNVLSMIEDIEGWRANLDAMSQQSRRESSLLDSMRTLPEEVPTQPREPERPSTQPEHLAPPERAAAAVTIKEKVQPTVRRAHKVVQPPKLILNQDAGEQLKTLKMNLSRLDKHLERLGIHSAPITKDFRRYSDQPQASSTKRSTLGSKKDKAAIMEAKQKRKPPVLMMIHPVRGASGVEAPKDAKLPQELRPAPTGDTNTGSESGTTIGSEMSENSLGLTRTQLPGAALVCPESKETRENVAPAEARQIKEVEPTVEQPMQLASKPEAEPKELSTEKATMLSPETTISRHSLLTEGFVPQTDESDMEAQEAHADPSRLEKSSR